ncbi:MAG: OmpA family protein [Clostridiaceae bacterium]|nr:OmpA family protein [Clostridiaceae bacterium]
MKFTRRYHLVQNEEHYWPSFTDVMSSLVLVLFFFIIILTVKQIVSAKTWDNQLNEVRTYLSDAQKELDYINSQLSIKKEEMADLEKTITDREMHINELQGQLDKDRYLLSKKESELNTVKSQLEQISLLRLDLLEEVKASIERELGNSFSSSSEPLVAIDNNANLVIQSSLLFAKGSSEISLNGKNMLSKFALAFEKVLSNPNVRKSIDSITISGYADSDDTFQNNYALSCERAVAVINTMMEENPVLSKNYGRYFQASGFSEFRPLVEEVDEASKSKNRRIQISINIKDSQIQQIIDDYMNKQP